MSLTKLISTEIPPLKASETADNGLLIMDDYKVKHLPVVSDGMQYCGLVSDSELYDMPDGISTVGGLNLAQPCASLDESIFGVLQKASRGKYSMLPVIDGNRKYQGYITPQSIIEELACLTSAEMPGGEIELESEDRDFSPALISGVAENNSMKITSMLTEPSGSHGVRAIIKLNGPETSSVIQGLERNGYRIRNVRHGDSKYSDLMEDRYKALMRYMEM
ncbi:MAG: CBS domain-containing protein [Bacteroidales bacterium]|nr:CBS domain-containing protein [Bacteroidales bacterium]